MPVWTAREQQSPTRGVGHFVATHEDCGAGFEIIRNGRGRLYLVCGACGERTQYGAEDTEQLRAHGVDPEEAATGRRFQPRREKVEQWLPAPAALPWWVPNAYIVALILVGLGLIAIGVLRPGSDDPAILGGGDQEEQSPPADEGNPPEPVPAPAPAAKPAQPKRPARPNLNRVEILGRFVVGVPEGWGSGVSGGAVVFEAPSDAAMLRVFLEPDGDKPGSLSDEAAAFLRQEHPVSKVSKPQPTKLGRFRAVRVVCWWPGGRETATLLSAHGYSYLILSELKGDAPASARRASSAALRSFRPL